MYRARAVCTSEGGARGSTYSMRAVHIPCTVKTMRQLSCTIDRVRLPLSASLVPSVMLEHPFKHAAKRLDTSSRISGMEVAVKVAKSARQDSRQPMSLCH